MAVPRLDHVQIAAPPGCEPAARHFFGDLLGLEELRKPAPLSARGGCWFALADHQLHVGIDPEFVPARKAHVALRVDPAELDDLAARLSAAGFPVTWDTALPTERRFYSADPWGNRIEFLAEADQAFSPTATAASRTTGSSKERPVDPHRLDRRPPAQTDRVREFDVHIGGGFQGEFADARRDSRRSQFPFGEEGRIVEIDRRRPIERKNAPEPHA